MQLQSGCGMREPEARSYNTTAGRVGAGRELASDSDELRAVGASA